MKPGESDSSADKEGVHQASIGEDAVRFSPGPRAPLTDEVEALARKVFLKFDLLLVLPPIIIFCESQCEYSWIYT